MKAAAEREDAFVPFGPATLAAFVTKTDIPPQLRVVPANEAAGSFSPLLSATGTLHGSTKAHDAASVSVQKDGDRVASIRVECTCGQVIEISCSYGA